MSDQNHSEFQISQNRKRDNFTIVNNDAGNDTNLSLDSFGLLAYLLQFPKDWKYSMPQIMKKRKIPKRQMYECLNELILNGYIKRETYLDAGKKRFIYIISDFKEFLLCHAGEISPAGRILILSNTNTHKEPLLSPKAVATAPEKKEIFAKKKEKIEVSKNVFITDLQRERLLEKYQNDEKQFAKICKGFSDWKISKGEITGSDYFHLSRWKLMDLPKPVDVEENKALANEIDKKFKRQDIIICHKYIEFVNGQSPSDVIEYLDRKFREKVIEQLKKRKLKL